MAAKPDFHTKERLLLFMSVDLAGSTAFKNKASSDTIQPWLKVFVEFYREFPNKLQQKYLSPNGGPHESTPFLWKAIGDELVFVAEISVYKSIAYHLVAFRKTIREYRQIVQHASEKLDLKATAWVAGFPVINSVLSLGTSALEQLSEADFIGPSIDTGFRLGKLASPRRFVLSVELVYLLTRYPHDTFPKGEDFHFYYEGGEELKGVLGGYPYPIIWTDLCKTSDLEEREREVRPPDNKVDVLKLFAFVSELIRTLKSPLFIPFIKADSQFQVEDPQYNKKVLLPEAWLCALCALSWPFHFRVRVQPKSGS